MHHKTAQSLYVLGLAILFGYLAFEQGTADESIKFPVEMGTMTVELKDSDGKPIEGAEVTTFGIRCQEHPGNWYGWPRDNAGADHEYFTNASGKVVVKYPKKYGNPPDYLTTTKLDFQISHTRFVSLREETPIDVDLFDKQLIRGCNVEFSAVDPNDVSVSEFGVTVAGTYETKWKLTRGIISTGSIPDGYHQTMLAAPQPNGQTLFSDVLPARYLPGGDLKIRNVRLRPGLRIGGRLSDNVPRPISDGIVIAYCLPKPTKVELAKREAVTWSDSAKILEDGSFQFDSLPRTGLLQLIAVCRGWVIIDQPREERANPFFVVGTLISLDELQVGETELSNVKLEMEPAGSILVKVKSREGTPLSNIMVSTSPNQFLEHTGSQLLGRANPSIDYIKSQIDPSKKLPAYWDWDKQPQSRYRQRTDNDGKTIIFDIPLRRNLGLGAGNENYQTAETDQQPNRQMLFNLESADEKQIDVIVEPIKKD